jgi:hypothetical protein
MLESDDCSARDLVYLAWVLSRRLSPSFAKQLLPVDEAWEVFFLFRNEDANDETRPRGRDRSS